MRTKNNLYYILSAFLLFFASFYLRCRRVVFSFAKLGFTISDFSDFFYLFSSFLQDIFFILLLCAIFCLLSDFLANFNIPRVIVNILSPVLSLIILIYGFFDLAFFQTSGVSISFAKIQIVSSSIFDLFDSFMSYMTGFDIFVLVFIGFLIVGSFVALHFVECPDWIAQRLSFFAPSVRGVCLLLVFYVFFNCYIEVADSAHGISMGSQPAVHLFTHFDHENAAAAPETQAYDDTKVFRPFSRDSKIMPISIMDRQISESVLQNAKTKKNYNIVLYLSESTFAGYYPFYNGNTANIGVSPFIEEKLSNSLLIKHAYSTGVRSINSIINLLTGTAGYPGYKQINDLSEYFDTPAMSQILAERGYGSALVHGGNFYFYQKMSFLQNRSFDFLTDAMQLKKKYPAAMSNSWGIDDRCIVKEGLKWIDTQISQKKNFTLTLVPIAPHHPYEIPADVPKYIDKPKNDFEAYLNSLKFVDEIFKMLYEGLEQRNLIDDTIIVFMADHGEAFGQHKGNYGHENHIYEENVRVPMIFFNPKLFVGYNELETVANLGDVLPTLLDILHIDVPVGCQGESILSRSTNKYSFFGCGEKNVDIGMIDGHYKAVFDYINNKMSLYDLSNELYDFTDISERESRLTMEYKKILTSYYEYQKNYLENFNQIMSQIRLARNTQDETSLLDMTPFFVAQNKYEVKKNRDYKDNPIKILDKTYDKGYGVYANSDMKFDIKGLGFTRFKGICGKLDVPSWRQNFLEMRIYVDGTLAFNSGKITTDDPPLTFDVDITGGEVLELMVLDGGDADKDDNAAWINPVLIK